MKSNVISLLLGSDSLVLLLMCTLSSSVYLLRFMRYLLTLIGEEDSNLDFKKVYLSEGKTHRLLFKGNRLCR